MEIISQQLSINLNKTQMATILNEAMLDETANVAIKKILNPFLVGKFPQFPEHTTVTLCGTNADTGITEVTLKAPAKRKETTHTEDNVPEEIAEETVDTHADMEETQLTED